MLQQLLALFGRDNSTPLLQVQRHSRTTPSHSETSTRRPEWVPDRAPPNGYPTGRPRMGYPTGRPRMGYPTGRPRMGYPTGIPRDEEWYDFYEYPNLTTFLVPDTVKVVIMGTEYGKGDVEKFMLEFLKAIL